MKVQPIKTRIFKEGEELFRFVTDHIKSLKDGSVLVVTSKIVALSERRTAIPADSRAKERLIREESEVALLTKHTWLTIKDGLLVASAGIDESNANGKLILLPRDSFKSAQAIRLKLRQKYGIKNLGVLITDSRTIPLRAGAIGMAVGYAGFRAIKDYRKTPDIFGRKYKLSRANTADGLAAAAVLVMGEGREQQPLAIITGAPIEFCDRIRRRELLIDIEDDMYRPLFIKFR
jgi:coenzyme F420-0:L-glutamate ligase